jgi:type IV secretory pathway component VirB8
MHWQEAQIEQTGLAYLRAWRRGAQSLVEAGHLAVARTEKVSLQRSWMAWRYLVIIITIAFASTVIIIIIITFAIAIIRRAVRRA